MSKNSWSYVWKSILLHLADRKMQQENDGLINIPRSKENTKKNEFKKQGRK